VRFSAGRGGSIAVPLKLQSQRSWRHSSSPQRQLWGGEWVDSKPAKGAT